MGSLCFRTGRLAGNLAMDGVSLEDFQQSIIAVCTGSSVVESVTLYEIRPNAVRLRIFLVNQTFLDVFYNEWNGRTSFAWIVDGQRKFGADNAGNWHWHLRQDPAQHVASEHEITFGEFMKEIEKIVK